MVMAGFPSPSLRPAIPTSLGRLSRCLILRDFHGLTTFPTISPAWCHAAVAGPYRSLSRAVPSRVEPGQSTRQLCKTILTKF